MISIFYSTIMTGSSSVASFAFCPLKSKMYEPRSMNQDSYSTTVSFEKEIGSLPSVISMITSLSVKDIFRTTLPSNKFNTCNFFPSFSRSPSVPFLDSPKASSIVRFFVFILHHQGIYIIEYF
jgi:hypothetical protein